MNRHSLLVFAAATLSAVLPAAADPACCACAMPCAPAVVVAQPVEITPYYLVNQGPVYSGPGHYLWQLPEIEAPRDYPYVGNYYYYPQYQPVIRRRAVMMYDRPMRRHVMLRHHMRKPHPLPLDPRHK